ncbi:hypothetical protein GT022_17675 [Agaribacter marinus]|uniref:Phage tail family protein n=1 Tax=Virgibacillus salarius TaxID=447199 RepID=A0A941DYV3_9BACI|nr:distal tail protein Dit [Virgibacillus salarius]MBR7797862.1 phage tail family protein [Virgibacillus salarius]NAZ10572.1 hypothetical protein [Agaribacter marinus]WBX81097.1 phage tail family protein [Virgibacillus salarius]
MRFVDTQAVSRTENNSLAIQTIFNENNLDKLLTDENGSFVTLTVSGRSNLKQRIHTTELPGVHGVMESKGLTWDVREIKVKYKISDQSKEGFRRRYNLLNDMLKGSRKELTFTDEDVSFYATLLESDVPEESTNSLVSTITFLCSDPFKYGKKHQTISLRNFTWDVYKNQIWGDFIGN